MKPELKRALNKFVHEYFGKDCFVAEPEKGRKRAYVMKRVKDSFAYEIVGEIGWSKMDNGCLRIAVL